VKICSLWRLKQFGFKKLKKYAINGNLTCLALVAQHHSQLQPTGSKFWNNRKTWRCSPRSSKEKIAKKYRPVHCPVREKNELVGIENGELGLKYHVLAL